jgi:helicase MOV-10
MSENEYCDICQCDIPGGGWDTHAVGRSHCRNVGLRTEAALQSAQRDRNGVSVPTQDAELDFGVVNPSDASKVRKSFTLKVTSETAEFMILDPQWVSSALRETACVMFRVVPHVVQYVDSHCSFSCGIEGDPHLTRGRTVRIIVGLRVSGIGRYEDTVEIRFARVSTNQQFSVTRTVKAIVGDAGYTSLLPTVPYVPRRRAERREVSYYVYGHPPPPSLAIAWRTKLARYMVPKTLQETLSLPPNRPDSGEDIVPTEIRSLFPTPLCQKNHLRVFSMLLWLEELAMEYANYSIPFMKARLMLSYP